jgi:hypothetical protein
MNTAPRIDFTAEQAADLLCRVKANALQEGDCEIIEAMINTIIALKQSYEKGKIYIKRLLVMIFGSKTEKKKKVLRQKDAADHQNAADQSDDKQIDQTLPSDNQNDDQPIGQDVEENKAGDSPEKDTKGHGRNGADVFEGAQKENVALTESQAEYDKKNK